MGPIAVALKHLIAAGVTGDALVTAVAEMEAATKPTRTAGAVRMARYRESKKAATEASQVTHSDACTPPDKEEKGFHTFLKEEINHPLATLATRAREGTRDEHLEFMRFWDDWPHKVGKPAAFKAFLRVRRTSSLEAIISGRDRYIAAKPPDRQWLNPATFLNQQRFNDEPAAVVEPAKRELPHDTIFRALAEVAENGAGAGGESFGADVRPTLAGLADLLHRGSDQAFARPLDTVRRSAGDSGGTGEVARVLPFASAVRFAR